MSTLVPLASEDAGRLTDALRFVVEATSTTDDYCTDYLISGMSGIDRDHLLTERVDHVLRSLSELDEIVRASLAYAWLETTAPAVAILLGDTVGRARALARAIRETIDQAANPQRERQPRPAANPYAHTGFEAGAL